MGDIETLSEMCGIDAETAAGLLEAAEGNLSNAVSLFFQDGASGVQQRPPSPVAPSVPEWYFLVWPSCFQLPPRAWLEQSLNFNESGVGIDQVANGPCGVLAVFQAEVWAAALRRTGGGGFRVGHDRPVPDDICAAAEKILSRCRSVPTRVPKTTTATTTTKNEEGGASAATVENSKDGQVYRLCSWLQSPEDVSFSSSGSPSRLAEVQIEEVPADCVQAALQSKYLDLFQSKGGAVLFLYSCLLTRGWEKVKQELGITGPLGGRSHVDAGGPGSNLIAATFGAVDHSSSSSNNNNNSGSGNDNGSTRSLIVESSYLCSFELLGLLLCGSAGIEVFAFDPVTGERNILEQSDVGLLSSVESEIGMTLHSSLRCPSLPIWIVHGGDHFSLIASHSPVQVCLRQNEAVEFDVVHWNGLPPAGPRLALVHVRAPNGAADEPTENKKRDTFVKPVSGEIDSIVQADPLLKRELPHEWRAWRYEVVLAIDDPSIQGSQPPPDHPPPQIFEQGPPPPSSWRCRSCYSKRYETMCFGMNSEGSDTCQHCGQSRQDAGWSIWLSYGELPENWQRSVDAQYGPKIAKVLHTKWPRAEVSFDSQPAPSV